MALGLLGVGLTFVLLAPTAPASPTDGSPHHHWIVLLPIYTSLIPIYVAAMRRRNGKSDG